jgi:hypothetical protein
MSDPSYYFQRHGRRLALWTGIGAGLGFVAVGLARSDWGIASAGLALPLPFLALYRVMGDPAGVAIARGRLRWWRGTEAGSVALADIAMATEAQGCTIRTRDGSTLSIPPNAMPPAGALLDHLEKAGVTIERP